MKVKYSLKSHYIVLMLLIGVLNFIGILILISASNNNISIVNKQIIGSLLGFGGALFISIINYDIYKKYMYIIWGAIVFILMAVLIWRSVHHGAGRWIDLPVVGQVQPAELAKAGLILFMGFFFEKNSDRLNEPKTLLFTFALFVIPVILIFIEPNLSMAIIITVIFLAMIFCAGLSLRVTLFGIIAVSLVVGIIIFLFSTDNYHLIPLITDYQKERILTFLYPEQYSDTFFQQSNSIMAIGSGEFFGKGLFNTDISSVKAGNFLIEEDTDFIFAIIGEELGFRGCLGIFALYFAIIICILLIAGQAKDISGRVICVGTAVWIGFQTFTNVAVATAIFPNTGVTLPFISRGVSSLLALYLAIGVVLNISLQTKDY